MSHQDLGLGLEPDPEIAAELKAEAEAEARTAHLRLDVGIARDDKGQPRAYGVIIRDIRGRRELGRVASRFTNIHTDYAANTWAVSDGLREAENIDPTAKIQVRTSSRELAGTLPYEEPWLSSDLRGRPDPVERMLARELGELSRRFASIGYDLASEEQLQQAIALAREAERARYPLTGSAPHKPDVIYIEAASGVRGGRYGYGAVLRDSDDDVLAELTADANGVAQDASVSEELVAALHEGLVAALQEAHRINRYAHLHLRINGPKDFQKKVRRALLKPKQNVQGHAQTRQLVEQARELLSEFPFRRALSVPQTSEQSRAEQLASGASQPIPPRREPEQREKAKPPAAQPAERPRSAPNTPRQASQRFLVRLTVQPGADPGPRINALHEERGISTVLNFDNDLHNASRYPAYLSALYHLLDRHGTEFHQGAGLRENPVYREVTAAFNAAWREAEDTLRQRLRALAQSGASGVLVSSYPDRATIPNLTRSGYLRKNGMYPTTEFVGTPFVLGATAYQHSHLAALHTIGKETGNQHLIPHRYYATRMDSFSGQARECVDALGGNQRVAVVASGRSHPANEWSRQQLASAASGNGSSVDRLRTAGTELRDDLRTMNELRSQLPPPVRQEIHRLADETVRHQGSGPTNDTADMLTAYRGEFAPESPRRVAAAVDAPDSRRPRRVSERLFPKILARPRQGR